MSHQRGMKQIAVLLIIAATSAAAAAVSTAQTARADGTPGAPQTTQSVSASTSAPTEATSSSSTQPKQQTTPDVVVDGNHPDTTSKVTHEQIDTALGGHQQSKRVKKILPPYLNRKPASFANEPLRPPVVDELLVTEIRHDDGKETDVSLRHVQLQPVTVFTAANVGQQSSEVIADDADDSINSSAIIQGIRLVPNQPHVLSSPPPAPATTAARRAQQHPVNTPQSFIMDENLPQSGGNVEKHELPFKYANIWQEVRDAEFFAKNPEREEEEEMKFQTSKSIPSLVAVSSDEELTIPADISHLLKLSQVPEDPSDNYVGQGRIKWYLLLLRGNATIVQQRRGDFTKYLRLNLAARLSVEYDDIKVNQIVVAPPRVLVNISIYAPSDDIAEESQLDLKEKLEGEFKLNRLAENNATLLELSGEEYRVVRFLTLPEPQKQTFAVPTAQAQAQEQYDQPHYTSLNDRHGDIEFVIYTILGSACACAVILTIFLGISKYAKRMKRCRWPWRKPSPPIIIEECQPSVSPAVIYSGGFPQIRGSWMAGNSQETREENSTKNSSGSLLQRYPGIELNTNAECIPESPRHNKLRMYNCQPDRVLVREPNDMH